MIVETPPMLRGKSGEDPLGAKGVIPPFDPELESHVARIRTEVDAPLTAEKIAGAKERSRSAQYDLDWIAQETLFDASVYQIEAERHHLDASIFLPKQGQPYGIMLHLHGGGMVAGSARSLELLFDLKRAEAFNLAVVSPDYRLAPDHPHPAPVDDCFQTLQWLDAERQKLLLGSGPVLLSGNSAGGGLAMSLALLSRDRQGPLLAGAMLQCPMLDNRCATTSAVQMTDTGVWDTTSNRTGWRALLGPRYGGVTDAYAAAVHAGDLTELPPIFIDVGSVESLRDEALDFAQRLWSVGGDAELHVWSGAFHSFDQWVPQANVSVSAEAVRMSWLERVLSRHGVPRMVRT